MPAGRLIAVSVDCTAGTGSSPRMAQCASCEEGTLLL